MTLEVNDNLKKALDNIPLQLKRKILWHTINHKIKYADTKEVIIININVPGVSASCLQEVVRELGAAMVYTIGPCSQITKSINDLKVEYENFYPILKNKEHNKHGWYRKFEKKRFLIQ